MFLCFNLTCVCRLKMSQHFSGIKIIHVFVFLFYFIVERLTPIRNWVVKLNYNRKGSIPQNDIDLTSFLMIIILQTKTELGFANSFLVMLFNPTVYPACCNVGLMNNPHRFFNQCFLMVVFPFSSFLSQFRSVPMLCYQRMGYSNNECSLCA